MSRIWPNVWPFGADEKQEEQLLAEEDRRGSCLNRQGKNEDCATTVYIELQLIKDNSDQITKCTDVLHDQDKTMVFERLQRHQPNSTAAIPVPSPTSNTVPMGRKYGTTNIHNVTGEGNHITNTLPAQDTLQSHKDTLSEDPSFSLLTCMVPTDHLIAISNANDIKRADTLSPERKLMKRPTCTLQNHTYVSQPSLLTRLDSTSSSGRLSMKMSCQRPRHTPIFSTSSGYSSFSRCESPCTNQSDPAVVTLQAHPLATNREEKWLCERVIDSKSNSCENSRNTNSKSMYLEDLGESAHYDRFESRSDLNQLECSNNSQHSCCFTNLNVLDRGHNLLRSIHSSHSFSSRKMCDASTSPIYRPDISWKRLTTSDQTSISPVVQVAAQDTSTQHIIPVMANRITVQSQKRGFPQAHYEHDAYLACNQNSNHDSHWAQSLSNKLEKPPYNFRTYWYERDHILGRVVIQDKADQIQNSYKFICLLSPEFLNSSWCMKDLQMAITEQTDHRSAFGNFVIVLKIAPCKIPNWIKDIDCEDCVACAGEPNDYVVEMVGKAIRDDK